MPVQFSDRVIVHNYIPPNEDSVTSIENAGRTILEFLGKSIEQVMKELGADGNRENALGSMFNRYVNMYDKDTKRKLFDYLHTVKRIKFIRL